MPSLTLETANQAAPASIGVPQAQPFATRAILFARREPAIVLCLLFLLILAVMVAVPGLIAPYDATTGVLRDARSAPSRDHLFGTDSLGRDVFSRVIYGARISLLISVVAVVVGVLAGGLIGAISGYMGGRADTVIMRFIDIMLAFPGVLLAMAIIAARGRGIESLVIAIGIAAIPDYARLVRGQVMAIRQRPFVEAAIASGVGPTRLVTKHVVPNVVSPIIAFATIGIGFTLIAGSSLSYIGLGAQPPSPEWGAMLADGRQFLNDAWWISTFPGLAIFLTVIVVNVLGQWLRIRLNPRRR
jgi:peptide/nickel transport system permease protein